VSEVPVLRDDCIFCRIIEGREPSVKVYEDSSVVAFMDIYPINPGHLLVVPKRHVERFDELTEEEVAALARAARRLAPAVIKAVGADGYNIVSNNGRAAGQVIFHVHLHIVPRFSGDHCRFDCRRLGSSWQELERVASLIRESLAQR
jgi:histidine triad (HIT) family protein